MIYYHPSRNSPLHLYSSYQLPACNYFRIPQWAKFLSFDSKPVDNLESYMIWNMIVNIIVNTVFLFLMKMFIWGALISVEYFHDEYFLMRKKGTMAIYYLLCGNFSELGSTGFNSIWNLQDLSQKCSHFFNMMIKVKIKRQVVVCWMFDEFVTLHFICRGFAGFWFYVTFNGK